FQGSFAITNAVGSALPWLEPALALARREGFETEEALGIYTLGVAHWFLGDHAAAGSLVAGGIDAFPALDDPARRIPSPINVGEVRIPTVGGRPGVRIVLEDSFQPFVEVSCDAALSYALVNQATIVRVRGDFDRSRALLDESDERFLRADDERGRTDVLVRRAYLHIAEGSTAEARACLEQALDYRRRTNDRRGIGLALSGLGMIDTDVGDYAEAERRLDEARSLFRRAGDRWGLIIALLRTTDLEIARDRLDAADAALAEAEAVVRETDLSRWNAHLQTAAAEVAALRGDDERASRLFGDAGDRYAANADAVGAALARERLRSLAK